MRFILIDWLFEVASDFKLTKSCLYNAVNILDLYIKKASNISKQRL